MHDILLSIILGVVEGITEFLPISSTAHLLVTERLLGLGADWEAFTVVIQLGAILAVVAIYFQVFWKALTGLPTSAEARRFAIGIILALLPSVVAGLALKKLLDKVLLDPAFAMPFIAGCWIAGGLIILLFERVAPKPRWFDGDKLPLLKAFQIGCCQILSIIPGVSRSGATILGAELLGVDRRAATLFTFYLAVPTMLGATILELHHKGAALSRGQDLNIAIGFVVSFVVAFFVIRGFLNIVTRYGLKPFGWYRIAAGLALIGYLAVH
ncbi:MAG TPA: undecaprenyl-diphosphate phosphatase [Rhizomicrobium sp.]|nr:undecaprenyl-diphosphate phosphatase [Rhizomicrobium sp.]